MRLYFVAWVGCAFLCACGPSGGEDPDETDELDAATDDSAPGSTDQPSGNGGSPNAPEPGASASTMPGSSNGPGPSSPATNQPTDPAASGSNNGEAFEAGVPETLIDALDFPGRMATDGVNIYIANRRHFQVEPESPVVEQGAPEPAAAPLDQLLVWPVNGSTGDPSVLFEHPDISGVAVNDSRIYVASIKARHFAMYDKTSGEQLSVTDVPVGSGTPYQVVVSGQRYFFALSDDEGAAFFAGEPGVAATPVLSEVRGSPMWMLASGSDLYVTIGGQSGSSVWALDAELGEHRVVAQTSGWAGALALHGDALLYTDWADNRLERVDLASSAVTTVAPVTQPWGLVVDGDYAYVSTQPDFCRAEPEGTLQRVSLLDGSVTQLTDAVSCPSMMFIVGDWLYWLNNGQVDDSSGNGVRSLGTGSLARLPRSR